MNFAGGFARGAALVLAVLAALKVIDPVLALAIAVGCLAVLG